jgi:hypothetical protein
VGGLCWVCGVWDSRAVGRFFNAVCIPRRILDSRMLQSQTPYTIHPFPTGPIPYTRHHTLFLRS